MDERSDYETDDSYEKYGSEEEEYSESEHESAHRRRSRSHYDSDEEHSESDDDHDSHTRRRPHPRRQRHRRQRRLKYESDDEDDDKWVPNRSGRPKPGFVVSELDEDEEATSDTEYTMTKAQLEHPGRLALLKYDKESEGRDQRFTQSHDRQVAKKEQKRESDNNPEEGTRRWEQKMLGKPKPAAKAIPMHEFLKKVPQPHEEWASVATTEDMVFLEFGIPASARLCSFHFDTKRCKSGCTNPGCRYSHSPWKLNRVQYALLPEGCISELLKRHNERQFNRGHASKLTEMELTRHTGEIKARRSAAVSAGFLQDKRYDGIDWFAKAQPRATLEEGRDSARKKLARGPTGKILERPERPKVDEPREDRRSRKAAEDNQKPPNADPNLLLEHSVLGKAEKIKSFLYICYHGLEHTAQQVAEVMGLVRSMQRTLLDPNSPMWTETQPAWESIEQYRQDLQCQYLPKAKEDDVKFVMNDVEFNKRMLAMMRKMGLEPPQELVDAVEGRAKVDDADEDPLEPKDSSAVEDPAPTPSNPKKQKKGTKGPAKTAKQKAGESVLPIDANKFDIYASDGEEGPAEQADLPLAEVLAPHFPRNKDIVDAEGWTHPASSKLGKISLMTAKTKRKLEEQGFTQEQREAMQARDAREELIPIPEQSQGGESEPQVDAADVESS